MIEAVENHMPEALVRLQSPPVPCKQTRHASCAMFLLLESLGYSSACSGVPCHSYQSVVFCQSVVHSSERMAA